MTTFFFSAILNWRLFTCIERPRRQRGQKALTALGASRGYVLQTGEIVLHDTAENLNEMVRKAYLGEG